VVYELRYVRGTKMPHSIKNIPRATRKNGISLKSLKFGDTLRRLAMGLRGRRLRTSILAMARRKTRMKPKILVAHAKPTAGKSRWTLLVK
jgi:hypothetical protein